jgi:amino acid adenylation domain-containing protein
LLGPRRPDVLVAILAIMKAGGAYVALDLSHPRARRQLLLDDAGAHVLIVTGAEARAAAAELAGVEVVDLDLSAAALELLDASDLATGVGGEDLAYVVYTSGTAGRPKGVLVEHRNLVAYSEAVWAAMELDAGHRFALVSSLSTDLGHTMIFPPLAHGGCVVTVPEEASLDAAALARLLGERPVDAMKLAPSHLAALLASPHAGALLPRRLLVLGGEACPPELIARVRRSGHAGRILNHYGPSETTIGALTFELHGDADGPVPVGYPLAGVRAHVLDPAGRPVPCGIAGELYIGGSGVARGYVGGASAEIGPFLEDPFAAGQRMYRTGDRAKRRSDGAILFLGRSDRQVKVRGFRVELEEVEHLLAAHAGVARAVVIPADEAALAAYVLPAAGSSISADDLRDHLRALLPGYMVPGAITLVERLPLTAGGKVDVGALRRAQQADRPPPDGDELPSDGVEAAMREIWEDVLGRSPIGVGDDFFELGGHSLLAVEMMARIDARFGRELPLAVLFERRTIAGLSTAIREGGAQQTTAARSPVVPIQPSGTGPSLVCVHPAGGEVLCYEPLARALGDCCRFFGLRAVAAASGTASIVGLAHDYAAAVRGARLDRGSVLAGWSMGALVAFEIAAILAQAADHVPAVVIFDQPVPEPGGDEIVAPDDDVGLLDVFAGKVSRLIGTDLGVSASSLAGRGRQAQAASFLEQFKRHGLAPETATIEGFSGFLDLLLTHNRMTAAYRPGVYPGPVVVLRAQDGDDRRPPDLGWQQHCTRPVEVVTVPGDHVSMMRSPHVEVLAQRLGAWIDHAA